MRHVSQMNPDLKNGKALIVGKGPSFDHEAVEYYDRLGYFIISINNAYVACPNTQFDLCVFSDWYVMRYFADFGRVKHYATLTTFSVKADWDAYLPAMLIGPYINERLYFFDGQKYRKYAEHEPMLLSSSSSEAAIHMMAHYGISEFHFIGCDGTIEHHDVFEKRPHQVPMEGQFWNYALLERRFSLTYRGLPKKYEDYRVAVANAGKF